MAYKETQNDSPQTCRLTDSRAIDVLADESTLQMRVLTDEATYCFTVLSTANNLIS